MTGDRLLAGQVEALAPAGAVRNAQLDLTFEVDGTGRTWLRRQRAAYPFHVGRAWSVPGDPTGMLTLYVQCCSGGVFQEDVLGLHLTAKAGARAHVSSAAATVVHTMTRGDALQTLEIDAQAGALVEYLPDPLILFPGARLRNVVRIQADPHAQVMLWDAVIAHDPAGAARAFDWLHAELSVADPHSVVLARDRYRLAGEVFRAAQPGVMHGYTCQGSFVVVQRTIAQQKLVEALRAALPSNAGIYAGATSLPAECGAWVRVLARDAIGLREALNRAWYAARRILTGSEPAARRK